MPTDLGDTPLLVRRILEERNRLHRHALWHMLGFLMLKIMLEQINCAVLLEARHSLLYEVLHGRHEEGVLLEALAKLQGVLGLGGIDPVDGINIAYKI